MQDITRMSAAKLSAALQKKELSAREAAEAYLGRINTADADVRAYISVAAERALTQAEDIDRRRAAGESLPTLAGVPVALKDNLCTTWGNTTCASRILHNFVSPYDATAVKKLEREGCVFLGKANLDEFAMGSST
ncbi:MAG: amidase, partial [Bacillota bacterium]